MSSFSLGNGNVNPYDPNLREVQQKLTEQQEKFENKIRNEQVAYLGIFASLIAILLISVNLVRFIGMPLFVMVIFLFLLAMIFIAMISVFALVVYPEKRNIFLGILTVVGIIFLGTMFAAYFFDKDFVWYSKKQFVQKVVPDVWNSLKDDVEFQESIRNVIKKYNNQ